MQDYRMLEGETSGFEGSYAAYVGLDVHKGTIAVAVAPTCRDALEDFGVIAHRAGAVAKLARELSAAHGGERPLFSYEAGPCGYGLYRLSRGGELVAVWVPDEESLSEIACL